MADRERVMRGLEHCARSHKSLAQCKDCLYYAHMAPPCIAALAEDALALLKEQEPRVMTLEEVLNVEDGFVWAEIYSTHKWDWCVCYVKVEAVPENDEILSITEDCGTGWTKLKSEYGKRGFLDGGWRCWTSRPTEEQRKAAKWE